VTATLFNANAIAAADRVAAADHIPAEQAHHVLSATAPLVCATRLREIAATAHQTVNTRTGCYRVVRADDLVRIAGYLDAEAAESLKAVVADATTRHQHETLEIDRLRAEVDMLRRQHTAVVDELVRRHLLRCDYIGEHPLTPERRAEIEADTRTTWAAIALTGA
jgi:hypothetical protein